MKNKWIITGVLWFAVIILTFYNASEVKRLKQESERIESLHMDADFWRENSKNIDFIKAEGEKLFFDVESVDMGYLAIDNRLKILSSKHHLQNLIITKSQASGASDFVPVDLSFEGSYEDIFKWFQSVKNELPFFRAKSIKIAINPASKMVVLNGSFFFRYRITTENSE